MARPATLKTKKTLAHVGDFIRLLPSEQQRNDVTSIVQLMEKASAEKPVLWGKIIGFGEKRYKSPTSGREVDWFKIGVAPGKTAMSLHMVLDLDQYQNELKQLGKHRAGKGCLYITKLADVDVKMLEKLIKIAAKK